MEELYRTTVISPEFLKMGLDVVTYAEDISDSDKKHICYRHEMVINLGMRVNPMVTTVPEYLRGKVKGLDQEIKLEIPPEGVQDVAERCHKLWVKIAETIADQLINMAMAKLVKSMGVD